MNIIERIHPISQALENEKLDIDATLGEVLTLLTPILQALEDSGLPVELVDWGKHFRKIVLKTEAMLTLRSFGKIKKLLEDYSKERGGEATFYKSVEKGRIAFSFSFSTDVKHGRFSDGRASLVIKNGDDSCQVRVVTKTVRVEAHDEERVTYEQVGDCPGLNFE